MSWAQALGGILYYVGLCLRIIFFFVWGTLNTVLGFLLVILAPVTYLGIYIAHGFLIPIYFLSKFETLYIYLGVAALIGLLTGSLLHFSSSILSKALNLRVPPENPSRVAASLRTAREKRRVENTRQVSPKNGSNRPRAQAEDTAKDYLEFIEKDRGKRREGQGLLSQIILEEDDDSEDEF